jgi:hypothetical protein
MGDPIRDKQALKIGVEATLGSSGSVILLVNVDSENDSSPTIYLTNSILWINNLSQVVLWTNNALQTVGWINGNTTSQSGYYLYKSDAQMYGKYLGMTINTTTVPITISGLQYEHELRARF